VKAKRGKRKHFLFFLGLILGPENGGSISFETLVGVHQAALRYNQVNRMLIILDVIRQLI
jgi:hypothetical protein